MNVLDFKKNKKNHQKISMITSYDFWSAQIINSSNIDCILVGDSASMIMHGNSSTIHATIDMMTWHTQAVVKGAPDKFIIADMPFLTFRKGITHTIECAQKLMQAGANAVKVEGVDGHEEDISFLIESGIPVMGHLGLTPQSVEALGGHKAQGKKSQDAEKIFMQAKKLEELGCFSLVLECIPNTLARKITDKLSIPTIGIGAGPSVDGQVLVFQDLLGMNPNFNPKFLKKYVNGFEVIQNAINLFDYETKETVFPNPEVSY